MDSRTAVSILLVIYGLCMLAEKTQGSFAHFYSHSDACKMQNRMCRKFVQRSEGSEFRGDGGLGEKDVVKMRAPLEIEVRLDSPQIENYQDIVEDLFGDEVQKT
ncbi:promotilin [Pelodytes ibericus]